MSVCYNILPWEGTVWDDWCISDILPDFPVSPPIMGLIVWNPLRNSCVVNFAFNKDVDVKGQNSLFYLLPLFFWPSPLPLDFYRAISMRIFAVFAEKVGSCWCVTHVHVFITWTVWIRLWKPFPRACGSVPNVKTRYCLTDRELYTMHCKDFSKLKETTASLGLLISRQTDTEPIYLICSKGCVNLI